MDSKTFKEFGYAAIDYIADYVDNLRERPVLPDVQPGYLNDKIPDEVPEHGEAWTKQLEDLEEIIMPGITHWRSPNFHAFFPASSSYPSIMGETFSAALGVVGLHWAASPVCTELEVKMMNWLGKLINLPEKYLNSSSNPGGGIIQGSSGEANLVCMLASKTKTIKRIKKLHPEMSENEIAGKLVAYTSNQANAIIEKAGILSSMKMRLLPTDENGTLQKDVLIEALEDDGRQGFFPCYLVATIGSTDVCSFDRLDTLGPICKKFQVWLHVDAAYAGSALILPEYQYLINGIEYVDSFNFNPAKLLLINIDCSALWVDDAKELTNVMTVDKIYLRDTEDINTQQPNWQIPLSRRFRALKLWFTLRTYGKTGLQAHIRNHINQANLFQSLVQQDSRFEISSPPRMGLVCFRLKGENKLTEKLYSRLMSRRNIYMVVASVKEKLVLRFVVCSRLSTESDIHFAWNEITSQADYVLANEHSINGN